MTGVRPRTSVVLIAVLLFLGLWNHGTRAGDVEATVGKASSAGAETPDKASGPKGTPPAGGAPSQTNEDVPAPSVNRIDYSRPGDYLFLNEHFGKKERILEAAATIRGKTPEEKLIAIHQWIGSKLVYQADVPYDDWRDFDRLLRDGNYGGCAEYSLVFGSLARACGIPTIWVKTLDVDWIRSYRARGTEGSWNGHVFLEVFIGDRWMLLDDVPLVLYEDYDPGIRILPGNRYAYDKGGDPFDLVLSSRWELWKKQTRAFCRELDLARLPVGQGRPLVRRAEGEGSGGASAALKYPAVFVFFSQATDHCARVLSQTLYPKLTHHLTARYHSTKDYQEQFTKWTKPGDTVILLLLTSEKGQVPVEFQDLLPESWSELEAEVAGKGGVRNDREARGMHIVLLVANKPAELTHLIQGASW